MGVINLVGCYKGVITPHIFCSVHQPEIFHNFKLHPEMQRICTERHEVSTMSVLCQSLQAPHITTPSFTKKEIMKRPRLHRSNQDPVIWSPRYQDRLYRHPTLIQLPHQTLPRTLPRGVHPPALKGLIRQQTTGPGTHNPKAREPSSEVQ